MPSRLSRPPFGVRRTVIVMPPESMFQGRLASEGKLQIEPKDQLAQEQQANDQYHRRHVDAAQVGSILRIGRSSGSVMR